MREEFIKVDYKKKSIKAHLNGVGFKEGDFHIIYLASLNISGYGETTEEANELIKATLKDFCTNLFTNSEAKVYSILIDLGWKRNRFFKKKLETLSETTFEDIRKEFGLPADTVVNNIPVAI